jgi:NhaA family Na+:H+ antiporter
VSAPSEREAAPVDRLLAPLQRFFRLEAASGVLLLAAAALAFAWANSPWRASYAALWSTPLGVHLGALALEKPLLLWVNDGLMALFFFVVGLEIKRELISGELREPRRAALPLLGALGGMAVPALVYVAFNAGGDTLRGWAIPAATDIAFAAGVLALLGPRAAPGLRVFLTALAIADDLGAVVVIALFYTSALDLNALLAAGAALAAGTALNRLGVRAPLPYALVGAALWLATLQSGVHATVAGVLLAFTIPARAELASEGFAARLRALLARLESAPEQRGAVVHALASDCVAAAAPLARLEHALAPLTAFVVMPVFALANAGVALGGGGGHAFATPVALGVALGLVVGKPLGVAGAAWLAVRSGVASLPAGVGWRALRGAACLAGIGFTMSLFIAGLAFGGGAHGEAGAASPELDAAKLGILAGSLLSGALGWMLIVRASPGGARVADAGSR